MATAIRKAQVHKRPAGETGIRETSTVVAAPGHHISRAWLCPLVKTLCTDISEAPGPETCRDCTVYKTWHTADNVDRRLWY